MSDPKLIAYLIKRLPTLLQKGNEGSVKVWLIDDELTSYKAVYERPVGTGAEIPSNAVQAGKVFDPEKEKVVAFLQSFGVSKQEAEHVVKEVGVSPS